MQRKDPTLEMINFSNLLKPALGLAVMGMLSLGASAQSCPTADSLGLTPQQRQQLYQITQGGRLNSPEVQQQIMGVLTPAQQAQLQQYGQQYDNGRRRRHRHRDYNNNGAACNGQQQSGYYPGGTYNPNESSAGYYNGVWYPSNPNLNNGYVPYNNPSYNQGYNPNYNYNPYNNGYYNNGYYPNQGYYNNNGAQIGIGILNGLLNSGILNGLFNSGWR